MSEQNEKLTAEELPAYKIYDLAMDYAANQISVSEFTERSNAIISQQVEHATAELRKELDLKDSEILSRELDNKEYVHKFNIALNVNEGLQFKIESLKTQLAEAQRQRDEANVLLKQYVGFYAYGMAPEFEKRVNEHLSRLSSGETNPASETPSRYEQDCYTRGVCPECNQNLPDKEEQP